MKWMSCAALLLLLAGCELTPAEEIGANDNSRGDDQAQTGTTSGTLFCRYPGRPAVPLRYVTIDVAGKGHLRTNALGGFTPSLSSIGLHGGETVTLTIRYDGRIPVPNSKETSPFMVMNDTLNPHSDTITATVHASGVVSPVPSFGEIYFDSLNCGLWHQGERVVSDYVALMEAPFPNGGFRIKRFDAVDVGTVHASYDYVAVRKNYAYDGRAIGSMFHEFGHTFRHAFDGDNAHFALDVFRYAYARVHSDQITNVQFAFNEGWASYWAAARFYQFPPVSDHPADFRDWSERLVAGALYQISRRPGVGDRVMVNVLKANPGTIHSLYEFEVALARYLGEPAPTPPADCPPGYITEPQTCRRDASVIAKPSTNRGVGSVPDSCGPGKALQAGLCYSPCPAGYSGVGPICWQHCPQGYADDGATCRKNASIIGADNSRCPSYDLCGLTLARGCSLCPAGYHNDGCTCRQDAEIIAKKTHNRGAGSVPQQCSGERDYEAGLCYARCPAGYTGVGPLCWGSCPADHDDQGGTCHRSASIIIR